MGEKSNIPKILVIANSVKTMKPISFFFHYRMRNWYLGNLKKGAKRVYAFSQQTRKTKS